MSALITKALAQISARTSLNPDTLRYCLARALEGAMCEFYRIRECKVDLDDRIVTPTFHVGRDMEIEEARLFCSDATYNDLIPVEFSFEMIHRDIVARTMQLFRDIIREVETDALEKKWQKQAHQAVEGVIGARYPDWIEVNLGDDARGLMYKPEWTPLEAASYREGKLLFFYVVKVVRKGSAVHVHLSRASIGLPGAILKTMAPWVRVETTKRIVGRKSWLRITPAVPGAVLREVRAKLNGEVIETACNPASPTIF
ncbi:MAG TPA: hypothetical protein ENH70_01825 [Desulfobacteraceae bacterium]|nr:hypothetical protein [Desulfobacteraceae bacterium]